MAIWTTPHLCCTLANKLHETTETSGGNLGILFFSAEGRGRGGMGGNVLHVNSE